MKKIIYIAAFTLLGILAQFLAHQLIEIWYIRFLVYDFKRFGFGLSWGSWFLIHHIASVMFFVVGAAAGYFSGKHWWRLIYEEKRFREIKFDIMK